MITYEIRMHKTSGDPLWYWQLIRHYHSSCLESAVRDGAEDRVEDAVAKASAEMDWFLDADMNGDAIDLSGAQSYLCATCLRDDLAEDRRL